MLTKEGEVKVLDFGLAKLKPPPDATTAADASTATMTAEGRVVGTFPYMSPEQQEVFRKSHRD